MLVTERRILERGTECTGQLDTAFFQTMQWAPTFPAACRAAALRGDLETLAKSWAKHLAAKRRPRNVGALLGSKNPYTWALSVAAKPARHRATGSSGVRAALPVSNGRQELLAGGDGLSVANLPAVPLAETPFSSAALALLQQFDAMLQAPSSIRPDVVLLVIERILKAAEADVANKIDVTPEAVPLAEVDAPDELLWHVLRHGELPWTVACLLPEVAMGRQLGAAARKTLAAALEQLCGPDAMPLAKYLPALPLLLASLTRSLALAKQADQAIWNRERSARWSALVMQSLRLLRSDGTLALVPEEQLDGIDGAASGTFAPEFAQAFVSLSGVPQHQPVLRKIQSIRASRVRSAKMPDPASESEHAQLAVLRSGWKPTDSMLAVRHDQIPLELDLRLAGRQMMNGPWDIQMTVDGRSLGPPEDCQVVCWTADEDVIYLELRLDWPGDMLLERQLIVARQDPFVLLADSFKHCRTSTLSYTATMTLADGLQGKTDRRSRIGSLAQQGRRRIWFLPLALDQWRTEKSIGTFEMEGRQVRLRAAARGMCLYAPLLVHALPARAGETQWRSLTVTDQRRVMQPDEAVGYRARIAADRQLLIYRSLGPCATRAVLGHQTNCEFVLGWFDRDGDVDPLLQVT